MASLRGLKKKEKKKRKNKILTFRHCVCFLYFIHWLTSLSNAARARTHTCTLTRMHTRKHKGAGDVWHFFFIFVNKIVRRRITRQRENLLKSKACRVYISQHYWDILSSVGGTFSFSKPLMLGLSTVGDYYCLQIYDRQSYGWGRGGSTTKRSNTTLKQ